MSDRDTIGFSQQNAAAQMNELEERMFRLSERFGGSSRRTPHGSSSP